MNPHLITITSLYLWENIFSLLSPSLHSFHLLIPMHIHDVIEEISSSVVRSGQDAMQPLKQNHQVRNQDGSSLETRPHHFSPTMDSVNDLRSKGRTSFKIGGGPSVHVPRDTVFQIVETSRRRYILHDSIIPLFHGSSHFLRMVGIERIETLMEILWLRLVRM